MKNNKQAESFIWIMIGVFLISIVILGIWNLLNYSGEIIREYEDNSKIAILRNNINNIVKNIDTSHVAENQVFYVRNDIATNTYVALTASGWFDADKYINEFGENVNPNTYGWPIYSRQLIVEREDTSVWEQNQVIKASIKRLIKKDFE